MHITRRKTLQLAGSAVISLAATGGRSALAQTPSFGSETVTQKARDLAKQTYVGPDRSLPEALAKLSYDDYRHISFRPEHTFLRNSGTNFGLQLFHRGGIFQKQVKVNLVSDGTVTPMTYAPELFNDGTQGPPAGLTPTSGFAGLRLLYPLNQSDKMDELASFLGASYFRFLGRGQHYGLSARGLSIGSGLPHEEFPDFVEFWVIVPHPGDGGIIVHALLDSPSVTGAYRFTFVPASGDQVDIEARLFARRDVVNPGFAPLTSMFLYGENTTAKPQDFRPEVHDSDGLSIHSGTDEWIWRPLRNPQRSANSAFEDTGTKGFGLLQRDRRFGNYQDLEAHYDLRPSYWVEMKTGLGKGHISLTELHSNTETEDNIVACWTPEGPLEAGSETALSYTIRALSTPGHDGGLVIATFETRAAAAPAPGKDGSKRFIIDFSGGRLNSPDLDIAKVELVASASAGTISSRTTVRNPAESGIRATFDMELPPHQDVDLRAFLRTGDEALTETWFYRYDAEEPA